MKNYEGEKMEATNPQTFRDRLAILMKGEKPYAWAKKVGIEKGLFQYYWQKGHIPTVTGLLKIQSHTGCSLDWLLTGQVVDPERIEELSLVTVPDEDMVNLRRVILDATRGLASTGAKHSLFLVAQVARALNGDGVSTDMGLPGEGEA